MLVWYVRFGQIRIRVYTRRPGPSNLYSFDIEFGYLEEYPSSFEPPLKLPWWNFWDDNLTGWYVTSIVRIKTWQKFVGWWWWKEGVDFCSFAGYDWWHLIFLWLLLWVSFVWCVVAVWDFFVGCQSRVGGGWSSSTKDFGNSWQLNILSFCVWEEFNYICDFPSFVGEGMNALKWLGSFQNWGYASSIAPLSFNRDAILKQI